MLFEIVDHLSATWCHSRNRVGNAFQSLWFLFQATQLCRIAQLTVLVSMVHLRWCSRVGKNKHTGRTAAWTEFSMPQNKTGIAYPFGLMQWSDFRRHWSKRTDQGRSNLMLFCFCENSSVSQKAQWSLSLACCPSPTRTDTRITIGSRAEALLFVL